MLNLCHRKFAHTKQSGTRGDLVSETTTNLGAGKRQSTVVESEQAAKVDKVALGGLRSEVTLEFPGRSDAAVEHEVKLDGLANFVVCVRIFDLV